MLYLPKEKEKLIIQHAKGEFPNEACGILAGKKRHVEILYRMTNTDESSISFFMDPKEQLRVMKEIRNAGLEMVGIYHSHPHTEAYPSSKDIEMVFYPDASYVIISLRDMERPVLRSFRIMDRNITEEEIRIT